jgi:hypothetical protein
LLPGLPRTLRFQLWLDDLPTVFMQCHFYPGPGEESLLVRGSGRVLWVGLGLGLPRLAGGQASLRGSGGCLSDNIPGVKYSMSLVLVEYVVILLLAYIAIFW